MKLNVTLLTASLAVMSLTACSSTYEGLKNDFSHLSNKVYGEDGWIKPDTEEPQTAQTQSVKETVQDGITVLNNLMDCPTLTLDPKLTSASEFYDMKDPSADTEISTIRIAETTTRCDLEDGNISMEINISFAGQLGSYAKTADSGKLFFAYPYFISVSDNNNNELAKEVFALSVSYGKNETTFAATETIKQLLPVDEKGDLPPYEVQVGFQLTEEQLFYNASN